MLVKIRGHWMDPEKVWGVGDGWAYEPGKTDAVKGAAIVFDGGVRFEVLGKPDEVAAEINEAVQRVRRANSPRIVRMPKLSDEDRQKVLDANDVVMERVFPEPIEIRQMKDDARERLDAIVDEAMILIAESGVVLTPADGLVSAVKKVLDRYALSPALTASENDRDRLHQSISEGMEAIAAAGVDVNFSAPLLHAVNKLIASRIPTPVVHHVTCPCGACNLPGELFTNTGVNQVTCLDCLRKMASLRHTSSIVHHKKSPDAFVDVTKAERAINPISSEIADGFVTMIDETVEPLCKGDEHFQAAGTDHCICGQLSLLEIKNYDMIQVQLTKRPIAVDANDPDFARVMEDAARKVAKQQLEKRSSNSKWAIELAVGAWCQPATSNIVMDVVLCDAFAGILDSLKIAYLRQPAMALAKELKISLAAIDDPLSGVERLMLPIGVVRDFLSAVNSIDGLKVCESRQVPLPGCD